MQLDGTEVDAVLDSISGDNLDGRLLLAETMLGEDAMQFLTTDLGRYVIGRLNQDRTEAYLALAKTAFWRRRRIVTLQQTIAMTERLMTYFRQVIASGRSALAEMERSQQTGEF